MPKPDDSGIGHPGPEEEDYFRDGALRDQSGDEFSHLHYAEVLSDILRKSKTPLNIGLYGKWGVGKSSIAHMLRDKIEKDGGLDGFRYAEVDAWGLSPKALPQGLLEALNSQLGSPRRRETGRQVWRRLLEALNLRRDSPYKPGDLEDMLYNKRQVHHTRLHNLKTWWWIPLAIIGASTFVILSEYPELVNSPVSGGFAAALLAGIAKLFFSTSRKTIPRAASSQQFGKIYGKIVERCSGKKLVVVIDNLDRCENAVVLELLGLIQTFMVRANCVNILACDDEALVSHLQRSETVRTERDGNEFLSKFFQVTLRISSFLGESLRSYAKKQIAKRSVEFDQFALTILLSGAIDNPRKINQFLNIAVALYRLAELREQSGMLQVGLITKDTNSLLKSVVLRHEWPEFCKAVEAEPDLYEDEGRQAEWCKNMVGGDKMTETESARLLEFLSATQIPGAVNIIPFLRMSQAPHMMQPGISAFEDAFSRSSPEAVRTFESLDSDVQETYLAKVGEILKESASETDTNMPALSSNVVMLASLVKAASGPVRERAATMLGQHISGKLLGKTRDIVTKIGLEPISPMPAPMRNRICGLLVSDALQADPPDQAVFDLFSKNLDMVDARLADRMDEMVVEKIEASGLWDESFVSTCLKCRRKEAPMPLLALHIISNATFGISPSTAGYDRLCTQLAASSSANESKVLDSRICKLVMQCSQSSTPLPPPLLDHISKSELDEQTYKALGGLVRASSYHAQNAEILEIVARKSPDGAEYLEPASYVFAAYMQTADEQRIIDLVGSPQYRRFLTTKVAIDSMLELCENTRYGNLAVINFLLTHTPGNLKEHVGSALSDAIASKHPSEYGPLLDAASQYRKEVDPDMNAEIMKACIAKAYTMEGSDRHDMYVRAAKIGHENHASEILAYADTLIKSPSEGMRDAGRALIRTLNEHRTETFHADFTVE